MANPNDIKLLLKKDGYEAWAIWDGSAEVYEIFLDPNGETYIGCADTLEEARKVALAEIADLMEG